MTRKVITFTSTDGRDAGKVFQITEMPASKAEKWATRALLAMARNGVDIPDDIASSGLAGIAAFTIKAICGMSFEEAEPLLDEMFGCIQFVTSADIVRKLMEQDIEEIATRVKLRKEVFKLHTDPFFSAGV